MSLGGREKDLTVKEPTGGIIYRGPSRLDRAPLVVVATGLDGSSTNTKTGPMAQTYILRADIHPVESVRYGADASICGDCPLRPSAPGDGARCYVNKGYGPAAVYRHLNAYPTLSPLEAGRIAAANGVSIRIGTYGDPGAVPGNVWRGLLAGQPRHTGYTHQWHRRPSLRPFAMASVDNAGDLDRARAAGWRTFRVISHPDELTAGEIICPASKEAGHRTQCARCNLCDGARPGDRRKSIAIIDHGPTAGRKANHVSS